MKTENKKLSQIWILLLTSVLLQYGCRKSKPTEAPASPETPEIPESPESPSTDFTVESLSGLAFEPGDIVTLTGTNLQNVTQLTVSGIQVSEFSKEPTLITFSLPGIGRSGLAEVALSSESVTANLSLIVINDAYPVITATTAQVCEGITFRDGNGALQSGQKLCTRPTNCASDGQINCLANETYPPVAISGLSNKIMSDSALGGVTGALTRDPGDCSADGDTNCIITGSLKAIDTGELSEWDIRVGKSVGGLSGKLAFYKNLALDATYQDPSKPLLDDQIVTYLNENAHLGANNDDIVSPITGWVGTKGENWLRDPQSDTGVGGGTANNGICDGTESCVYKERVSGLYVSRASRVGRDWESAISYCIGLNTSGFGGYTSGWRLPVEKEMQLLLNNGLLFLRGSTRLNIYNDVLTDPNGILGDGDEYITADTHSIWTATTRDPTQNYAITFGREYSGISTKGSFVSATLCVR